MMRYLAYAALVTAIAVGLLTHKAPKAPTSDFAEHALYTVRALRAGDTALIVVDIDPASRPELEPFVRFSIATALAHNAHVVTLSPSPQGAMIAQQLLDEELAKAHKAYGEDAVNLGFLEGRTAAVHLLGFPIDRVTSRDHAGTPLADLAISRDLQTLDEAALVILASSSSALDWLTQAQGRFARKLLIASTSQHAPELVPFFESGQLAGLIAGLRDTAAITPQPTHMAAQRWSAIAFIALLVLGHILQLFKAKA
jgi:hypothetical protein